MADINKLVAARQEMERAQKRAHSLNAKVAFGAEYADLVQLDIERRRADIEADAARTRYRTLIDDAARS